MQQKIQTVLKWLILVLILTTGPVVCAANDAVSLHVQFTNVTQFQPRFHSPYTGTNSLIPSSNGRKTNDLTLFAGVRLWSGGAFYIDPEVDQGFGLSNTLGVAGFPSAEAYKVGATDPYLRLQRVYFQQVIDLGGAKQRLDSGPNQLADTQDANNIRITLGKFSVVDIFDTNRYAHDPRGDFLNWSVVDAGAFDYAADAWGYSYGGAVEWIQSWWTLRGGVFDLSRTPNSRELERGFGQFALIGEAEARRELVGQPGAFRLLLFVNRGHMARYDDALRLAQTTGDVPDVAQVRRYTSRPGVVLNFEQALSPDLGVFVRASLNDGSKEAYDFTDINRALSAGLSLKGTSWGRPNDFWGLAGVINAASGAAVSYFAAGGLGILVGDGLLPHYGLEKIVETYYAAQLLPVLA